MTKPETLGGVQALRIITMNDEQYICDVKTQKVSTVNCFKVLKTSKLIKQDNFITHEISTTRVWDSVEERNMFIPAMRVKTIREIKYKLKAHPKL